MPSAQASPAPQALSSCLGLTQLSTAQCGQRLEASPPDPRDPHHSAHCVKKDSFARVLEAQTAQSPRSQGSIHLGLRAIHLNSQKLLVNLSPSREVAFFFVSSPGQQDCLVLRGLR